MKYASLELGTIEAVFNKLGGMEGAQRFLRGELSLSEVAPPWTETDGVITFEVVSDGTTGEDWITWFACNGYEVSSYAKDLLRSKAFKPTNGVTYQINVLKGDLYQKRITHMIRADAQQRGLSTPHPEVACLIRKKFTNEQVNQMGLLWIVIMHEPIKDSDGAPFLLEVDCDVRDPWLGAFYDGPGGGWSRKGGFAFASQVSGS